MGQWYGGVTRLSEEENEWQGLWPSSAAFLDFTKVLVSSLDIEITR